MYSYISPYRIDKNIPLPENIKSSVYPWEEMEVGDSFFVPGGKISTISVAANYRGKTTGEKYVCRYVSNGTDSGVRVWRLS
jgi:hypothetical protein